MNQRFLFLDLRQPSCCELKFIIVDKIWKERKGKNMFFFLKKKIQCIYTYIISIFSTVDCKEYTSNASYFFPTYFSRWEIYCSFSHLRIHLQNNASTVTPHFLFSRALSVHSLSQSHFSVSASSSSISP